MGPVSFSGGDQRQRSHDFGHLAPMGPEAGLVFHGAQNQSSETSNQ